MADPREITSPPTPNQAPPADDAARQRKLARLARLSNRPTLYEAEIVRADGERRLFCYTRKTRPGLRRALNGVRLIGVAAFLGVSTSSLWVEFVPGELRLNFMSRSGKPTGDYLRFTGRTQRDVIMDETPLTYVAKGIE